jgi:hypothetical protein
MTSIVDINKLALDLLAMDFSDGHAATNAGPTKTLRALAIVHLAARDAYAQVTGAYAARLAGLPATPFAGNSDALGVAAVIGAGLRACTLLYPDFAATIAAQAPARRCRSSTASTAMRQRGTGRTLPPTRTRSAASISACIGGSMPMPAAPWAMPLRIR